MGLNHNVALVTQAISTVVGVTAQAIESAATFVELGGDSLSAILISAECQNHGIAIRAAVFLRAGPLAEAIREAALSAQILPAPPSATKASSTPTEQAKDPQHTGAPDTTNPNNGTQGAGIFAKHVLERIDADQLTESQLLLLRGSLDNPKLNVVTLLETYTEWDIEAVCNAWTRTILNEPIFSDLIQALHVPPEHFLLWQTVQADTDESFEEEVSNAVNACGAISRITAIQSGQYDKKITVVWRIHHAFIDGYSARILRDKVDRTLRREPVTPGPPFKETMSLLRAMQEEKRDNTRAFWASKRAQYPSAISELRLNPQRGPNNNTAIPQRCITINFPDDQLTTATGQTGYTQIGRAHV